MGFTDLTDLRIAAEADRLSAFDLRRNMLGHNRVKNLG